MQVILIVLWMELHEKWKSQILFVIFYCFTKITGNYNSFEKMYPIKGLQSLCQKCMDKFFDPFFDVLMNWASHFENPQKRLSKFYLKFWRYLEKKNCTLTDLNCFLRYQQTCFVPSVGRDSRQWQILYVICTLTLWGLWW